MAVNGFLKNPIEYLKGVGPLRADLLKKELGIFTYEDLLNHFPFRHIDRTSVSVISQLKQEADFAQVAGVVLHVEIIGQRAGKRLVAQLKDKSGIMELTWFKGINWIQKTIIPGQSYLVFGRLGFFNGRPQFVHPEIEKIEPSQSLEKNYLEPVYSTTEKLRAKGLGGRQLAKLTQVLVAQLNPTVLPEILSPSLFTELSLMGRAAAYQQIHFPSNATQAAAALKRLKFEEFFIAQLRMQLVRAQRHHQSAGVLFEKVGDAFNRYYSTCLPFELTGAQKRVLKEIRTDTAKGTQMNRLLQGDVGSGKTIVALLAMLLAVDNGYQACIMAPTEILAQQHFASIQTSLATIGLSVALLTGSTKTTERKKLLAALEEGSLLLLVGTHALIEETVQFKKLGLVVIDEQHRFGVAQRARLWKKAAVPPHILVMTATPIPRTLAMTAYGDLDYSVIDELPPGRKPIQTVHRYEKDRSRVMEFIRTEIAKGRQIYIIYPLIEESAKLDYENLMKGYEEVKAFFPEPNYWISMVHGRQPAAQKEINMQRFISGDTQIMVATTVIEVGVNVPNATVMLIESAEKFGLSQLHQLRGRVGRGAEKSYCVLLTPPSIGKDASERMKIMVQTASGFEIAEKDLLLRGPGEIEGTRQSGALNFKLASLVHDRSLLEWAREQAARLLDADPTLGKPENQPLRYYLQQQKGAVNWSKIS
ncbi:MAG: ATP-dependent DNA helicase RecG [Bacteroidetes bacterium]|nr:ATP-dependent DNA helicase RecG [Bacteroidota bacterium]